MSGPRIFNAPRIVKDKHAAILEGKRFPSEGRVSEWQQEYWGRMFFDFTAPNELYARLLLLTNEYNIAKNGVAMNQED